MKKKIAVKPSILIVQRSFETIDRKKSKQLRKQTKRNVFTGAVRSADGNTLEGLIVRAFDRNLRSEEPLGEATTDMNGRYEITNSVCQAEEKPVGTIVKAGEKGGKPLAKTQIIFVAEQDEESSSVGVISDLKSIQRICKVTSNESAIQALLKDGIHSAQDIVSIGPAAFVKRYSKRLRGAAQAMDIYERAERIIATEQCKKKRSCHNRTK